jgi:Domain of unknown function (DUF4397)
MKLRYSLAQLVHRISLALMVFTLVALFGTQARPASAASPAFVRVVHASPDIGTADVFLDGKEVLSNFQFGTVTDYVTIPPGPHKVQIALIGKGIGAAVITQTLSVDPGMAYTVAALGANPGELSLKVFTDNNLLSNGKAKLRVYHLSPGIGSVNVFNGSNMIISGLGYPETSDYLTLTAGTYTFNVTTTQSNVTLPPVSTTLKENTVTSIFAVGLTNGTPQIEFVTAQVQGLPGVPPTGSDPNPNDAPVTSQSLTPWMWLFAALALTVIGAAVATRRLALAHRQA